MNAEQSDGPDRNPRTVFTMTRRRSPQRLRLAATGSPGTSLCLPRALASSLHTVTARPSHDTKYPPFGAVARLWTITVVSMQICFICAGI